MSEDYYAVLGVPRNASKEDIDRAYRDKAKKLHPDVNPSPDAANEFKRVAQAFEILGDPLKRADYDQGDSPFAQARFQDFYGHDPFFGGGHKRTRKWQKRHRHRDIAVDLEVAFMDAARGCQKKVKLTRQKRCPSCDGSGVLSWETCKTCGGSGRFEMRQAPMVVRVGCRDCMGEGKVPKQMCTCDRGFVSEGEEIADIDIPPGMDEGMSIRFQGRGEEGSDLVINIHILPHKFFRRQGPTLLCEFPVTYSQLVLGDTIDVPGLDGTISVRIPPGTAPGSRARLKGQGIPDVTDNGSRGDYYIVFRLEMPRNVKEYEDLVRQMQPVEKQFVQDLLQQYESP